LKDLPIQIDSIDGGGDDDLNDEDYQECILVKKWKEKDKVVDVDKRKEKEVDVIEIDKENKKKENVGGEEGGGGSLNLNEDQRSTDDSNNSIQNVDEGDSKKKRPPKRQCPSCKKDNLSPRLTVCCESCSKTTCVNCASHFINNNFDRRWHCDVHRVCSFCDNVNGGLEGVYCKQCSRFICTDCQNNGKMSGEKLCAYCFGCSVCKMKDNELMKKKINISYCMVCRFWFCTKCRNVDKQSHVCDTCKSTKTSTVATAR
jgi:hypothetical protein